MKDWDAMSTDEKIERLSRDLSIVWYMVFGAVGVALGALFIWIIG